MIENVVITNARGRALSLSLWDNSSGYSVLDISGLDPVKAEISSSSFASLDEEEYQASRIGRRNIVMQIGIDTADTGKTVRELRKYLYEFFMPKTEVYLRFADGDGSLYDISGRVESMEAPIFAKDPKATISILCFKPDFIAPTPISLALDTVNSSTDYTLVYDGTRPTGVDLQLQITSPVDSVTFQQSPEDGVVRFMEITYDFLAGDVLNVRTIPGAKKIYLNRAGSEDSILYALSQTATWVYLQPGENQIRLVTDTAGMDYSLTYNVRYGGL